MENTQHENSEEFEKNTAGRGNETSKAIDLDDVLVNELGQLGWFQIRSILLVAIPIVMSANSFEFIFSAAATPHRCQVSECGEYSKHSTFNPEWLPNVIPQTSSGFVSCERFSPVPSVGNGSLDYCPPSLFDRDSRLDCDGFVYANDNTVVYEFDLGCQEWLRALAGTLSSVGTLLVLPITGYVSDRFGRRIALVISIFNTALFGVIRAFSVNYAMYLVLQLLQTTFGAGIFSSAYIFGAELVGPKYRVLISAVMASMFSLGQVMVGSVAWLIPQWRYMILALHLPCFLIVSYYWILSESVRWLLSKKRFDEARAVLENVARVNKKQVSEKSMEGLLNPPQPPQHISVQEDTSLIKSIIKSPVLLRRICTTPIWWITTTFVYYGLSINSTSLSDTMHLNYILTCIIEIPGGYSSVFLLNRIGRKMTLSIFFFLSAICNIAFAFIPFDMEVLRIVIYLLGKFSISIVFTALYLYTSELYPTVYRHSLLGFSSMVGRIGGITAPLTPVLMYYWHGIPSVMFGCMALLSGVLVLTQPETLGTKMPDTLAEAEALGRPESKKQTN